MWGMSIQPTAEINWRAYFDRALGVTGIKQETLAALMGITPGQLSQQLSRHGHVSFFRLVEATQDEDGQRFVVTLFAMLDEDGVLSLSDPLASTLGRLMVLCGTLMGQMKLPMVKVNESGMKERRRA